MRRVVVLAAMMVVALAVAALAADYRYVNQDTFKQWVEGGKSMVIVDIQTPESFQKRHFKGSLETNAYPVKSDEDKKRLDATLERINATADEVVIVCPGAAAGQRTAMTT